MPSISKRTRRHILWFACAVLFAATVNLLAPEVLPLHYTATLTYCGILTAWILTVRKRVIQWHIRRYLIAAAGACALLFILRACRWDFFTWSPRANRLLWYAYYIPYCVSPLCILCAAKCVGKRWQDAPLRRVKWLWVPCGAMILGFLTNGLHGAAFRITGYENGSYVYTHGWLYFTMAAWTAALLLWAFSALLRQTAVLGVRKYWYVPVAWTALSAALIGLFLVTGGSPHWGRLSLYNFQEVWSALIVGTVECFIQIGLIPANNDYEEIFQKSRWDAVVADDGGSIVYHTDGAFLPTREQIAAALRAPAAVDADRTLYARKIGGGVSCWLADRSQINETNRQIAEAVEYLEQENDLLAEENRIRAARAAYETQNLIYDSVIPVVQPQLSEAERLLRGETADGNAYRRGILRAMVLCDYAKRRINLSLVAHGRAELSSDELVLAIRETLEYLGAGGVETALDCAGAAAFPTERVMMAYDFFEAALEAALPDLGAVFVHIETDGALRLRLVMETPSALPHADWLARQRQKLGAELELRREEGEGFARLAFGKGGGAE